MFQGLEHVWKAAQILAGQNAMLKDRLTEALGEFVASTAHPDEWPADLWPKASSLRSKLQDIDGMQVGMATQVAEDLLSLAFDVACREEDQKRKSKAIR